MDLNFVDHGKGGKKSRSARVKTKTVQYSSDEEGVEEVVAGEGDDLDINDNDDEGDLDEDEGDLDESEDDIDAVDLDYEDEGGVDDEDAVDLDDEDEGGIAITSNEEDDNEEEGTYVESGSDREEDDTPKEVGPGAQLVEVRDNIPDYEFEAMIRGECVPQLGEGSSMLEGLSGEEDRGSLVALILVPTRELALQVCAHIKDAAKFTDIRVRYHGDACQHTMYTHHTMYTQHTMYTHHTMYTYTPCTHMIHIHTHTYTHTTYTQHTRTCIHTVTPGMWVNKLRSLSFQACVLVGGMAAEKQERLLSQRPPIVIATPGRLWKLMSEVCVEGCVC